jgi:hypothetical protein
MKAWISECRDEDKISDKKPNSDVNIYLSNGGSDNDYLYFIWKMLQKKIQRNNPPK